MFGRRFYGARFFAVRYFGGVGAAPADEGRGVVFVIRAESPITLVVRPQ